MLQRGIGLFGGTFDPIHAGHIAVAHGALLELGLIRVDFVPAYNPWQKTVHTPIEHRIAMIESAIAGDEHLGINLCEVLRAGVTYTIDTLKEVRFSLGPSIPLVLLIGEDQWTNFHTWKHWDEYLLYASIAICNRTLTSAAVNEDVAQWAEKHFVEADCFNQYANGVITRYRIPAHAAKSSTIRETFATEPAVQAFRKLESWLPHPVAQYISNNHLYIQ